MLMFTKELQALRQKHDTMAAELSQLESEREAADNRVGELQQDLQN